MKINFSALIVAAISTLLVGFVWYHPKVFGTIWIKEAGITQDKMKSGNMALIFAMAIFYAFLITMVMQTLTIHQFRAIGMIGGDTTIAKPSYTAFIADYGTEFRTFKHRALHGFISGLFLALPIIRTNALFERKSYKYTLVNGGFWIVSFMLMGGIICVWK